MGRQQRHTERVHSMGEHGWSLIANDGHGNRRITCPCFKEEAIMNWAKWLRVSLLLLLTLGLAMPAMAQVQLYNSETPGSVIVFPKFINGTTASGEPRSEFEISVNCPSRDANGFCPFAEGTRVKLRAHWVCPSDQQFPNKFICKET